MPSVQSLQVEQGNGERDRAPTPGASYRGSHAYTHRVPDEQVSSEDEEQASEELTVGQGRFVVEDKLGQGSFGKVYAGWDRKGHQKVAIKVEHMKSHAPGQLKNESRIMEALARPRHRPGFAEFFHYSKEGSISILVMELLGMSLEDSIKLCGGNLNLPTTALVAEQAIHLLAWMHSKGIVHRDIKTGNFMWGTGNKMHHLYIVDFGMSTRFFIKKHTRFASGRQLTGTARFASINAMKGNVQSRRDDLESVGHLLMHTLIGVLPWSGLKAKDFQEKLVLICETKESTPLEELCKGWPDEFLRFMHYSRHLAFEQKPDYDMLASLFRGLRAQQRPPTEDWQVQWLAEQEDIDPSTMVPLQLDQPCAQQPEDVLAELARTEQLSPGGRSSRRSPSEGHHRSDDHHRSSGSAGQSRAASTGQTSQHRTSTGGTRHYRVVRNVRE